MRLAEIAVLALIVAAVVVTLRRGTGQRDDGSGTGHRRGDPDGDPDDADFISRRSTGEGADAFVYVPSGPSDHIPFRTRLLGLVGLIALVAVAAGVLALALWQGGHLVNVQLSKLLGK